MTTVSKLKEKWKWKSDIEGRIAETLRPRVHKNSWGVTKTNKSHGSLQPYLELKRTLEEELVNYNKIRDEVDAAVRATANEKRWDKNLGMNDGKKGG